MSLISTSLSKNHQARKIPLYTQKDGAFINKTPSLSKT